VGRVSHGVFSPDGTRLLTASGDHSAREWSAVPQNSPTITIAAGPHRHGHVVLSPDGRRTLAILGRQHNLLEISDSTTGQPLLSPFSVTSYVSLAVFDPSGSAFTTLDTNNTVIAWNAETGKALSAPLTHTQDVTCIDISTGGKLVATGAEDGTVSLWRVNSDNPGCHSLSHTKRIRDVAFSADSRYLVTCSDDHTARVWDAATGASVGNALEHREAVRFAVFSPDSRHVATGSSDFTARVWDTLNGKPLTPPLEHGHDVTHVSFSPDGRAIATASFDGSARVWDVVTGEPRTVPLRHRKGVKRANFSPDGRLLVTASEDGSARIWDALTGDLVSPVVQGDESVENAAFSSDGRHVLIATAGGRVRACEALSGVLPPSDLMNLAQIASGRRVIHRSMGLTALRSRELPDLWKQSHGRCAAYFNLSVTSIQRWREQQLDTAVNAGQWHAALFHLDHLDRAKGPPAERREQRATALFMIGKKEEALRVNPGLLPGREARADSNHVDLTAHFNALLGEAWQPFAEDRLAKLPRGLQTFDETSFDIRGVVQLSGSHFFIEKSIGYYPVRAEEIRVGRPGRRLHFLHGAVCGSTSHIEIGGYRINYEDGNTEEVPLVYGKNISCSFTGSYEVKPVPEAKIAWHYSEGDDHDGSEELGFYKYTWANPRPDQVIRNISFHSKDQHPAPFLLAITLE